MFVEIENENNNNNISLQQHQQQQHNNNNNNINNNNKERAGGVKKERAESEGAQKMSTGQGEENGRDTVTVGRGFVADDPTLASYYSDPSLLPALGLTRARLLLLLSCLRTGPSRT